VTSAQQFIQCTAVQMNKLVGDLARSSEARATAVLHTAAIESLCKQTCRQCRTQTRCAIIRVAVSSWAKTKTSHIISEHQQWGWHQYCSTKWEIPNSNKKT